MKTCLVGAAALATTLAVLTACNPPTGNESQKPEGLAPPNGTPGAEELASTPEALAPTVESLIGSWAHLSSSSYEDGSTPIDVASTVTDTYGADGSYLSSTVELHTPAGESSLASFYKYHQERGSFSVEGAWLTTTTTDNRPSALTPFADTTSGWESYGSRLIDTVTAVIVGKKLYIRVAMAQGTTSGLVGTWVTDEYYSPESLPYSRSVTTFNADGKWTTKLFLSSSWTFPAEPTSTTSGTYALSGSNQITKTQTSPVTTEPPSIRYYSIVGTYLFSDTDPAAGAYVKQ